MDQGNDSPLKACFIHFIVNLFFHDARRGYIYQASIGLFQLQRFDKECGMKQLTHF